MIFCESNFHKMNTIDDEIKSVQFGIASAEEIRNNSVVEIFSPDRFGDNTVYDGRMGPLDKGTCKTCFQSVSECPGHFGHINLVEPIANPLFINRLLQYFGIFCLNCSERIIQTLPKPKQRRNESFLSILNAKTKNVVCDSCETVHSQVTVGKDGILFKTILDEDGVKISTRLDMKEAIKMLSKIKFQDLKIIGINTFNSHPKDYILTVLPVLSHINRPFMVQGNQTCDDDLTALYLDIVKNNTRAKKASSIEQYNTLVSRVSSSIQTLFNNSSGNAKHPSSGRQIKGIAERLSGKGGLLRNHTMGKRCNFTARAVAVPGPHLKCGQVGIAQSVADILTKPILVSEQNINHVQQLCDEGKIDRVDRTIDGKICEYGVSRFCNKSQTHLEPGDVIMRTGELPITVVTGHEVIKEGDSIMRGRKCIEALPQRKKKFEIKIGDVASRYLQDGDIVLTNRQPTLHTGNMKAMNVVITQNKAFEFPLSDTASFNMDFDGDEANIHVPQSDSAIYELVENAHTVNNIISPSNGKPYVSLVQDTTLALYLMTKKVVQVSKDLISDSELERIVKIRKRLNILSQDNYDTFSLISSCLPHKLIIDTPNFQVICGVWIWGILDKSVSTLLIKLVYKEFGSLEVSKMLTKLQHKSVEWITRRGFTIDGNDVEPLCPIEIRNKIEQSANLGDNARTLRDDIHAMSLEIYKDKNIIDCVKSGAKGTSVNIGQIVGAIGQQQLSSGIIDATLEGDLVTPQDYPLAKDASHFEKLIYHGFICNSFASGLSPHDICMHAPPSRDAIIDTATKTAQSGYLQHRIIKLIESLATSRDGQVIHQSGSPKTISLRYNNNMNPFTHVKEDCLENMYQKLIHAK